MILAGKENDGRIPSRGIHKTDASVSDGKRTTGQGGKPPVMKRVALILPRTGALKRDGMSPIVCVLGRMHGTRFATKQWIGCEPELQKQSPGPFSYL